MALGLHIKAPVEKLAEMLSESTTMQTMFNVPDAATLLPLIGFGYAEDAEWSNAINPAQQPKTRPRCLIAVEGVNATKSSNTSFSTTIESSVFIEVEPLAADLTLSMSARYLSFLGRIEGVLDDLRNAAATVTRLNITDIRFAVAPQMANPSETDGSEIWWTVFSVTTGG